MSDEPCPHTWRQKGAKQFLCLSKDNTCAYGRVSTFSKISIQFTNQRFTIVPLTVPIV
nr:MAG TPA: hypothetical protein [Caudoviricetes sp.]